MEKPRPGSVLIPRIEWRDRPIKFPIGTESRSLGTFRRPVIMIAVDKFFQPLEQSLLTGIKVTSTERGVILSSDKIKDKIIIPHSAEAEPTLRLTTAEGTFDLFLESKIVSDWLQDSIGQKDVQLLRLDPAQQ